MSEIPGSQAQGEGQEQWQQHQQLPAEGRKRWGAEGQKTATGEGGNQTGKHHSKQSALCVLGAQSASVPESLQHGFDMQQHAEILFVIMPCSTQPQCLPCPMQPETSWACPSQQLWQPYLGSSSRLMVRCSPHSRTRLQPLQHKRAPVTQAQLLRRTLQHQS
jgi:hypothetical protein